MPWPSIPLLIFTDSTTWQKATWSTDRVAGRTMTLGASTVPLTCAVDKIGSEMEDSHGRQALVNQLEVTFDRATYPGLPIRSQGVWVETGDILTVTGVRQAGDANGRIVIVSCEGRPQLG